MWKRTACLSAVASSRKAKICGSAQFSAQPGSAAAQSSAVKHGGECHTLAFVAGAAPVQKLELDSGLKGRDDHVGGLDVPVVPPLQLVHGEQHLYGTHVMSASEASLDSRSRE